MSCGRCRRTCGRSSSTTCSRTGGHIGAGLGVVELTVALHAVLRHAARPAGVGRRTSGLSAQAAHRAQRPDGDAAPGRRAVGLPQAQRKRVRHVRRRTCGHVDLGGATAWRRGATCRASDFKVVAIIGDGSLTCGLAYEALNNAGSSDRDIIVVLNDNEMSIAPNVGAMHKYLSQVQRNPLYNRVRSADRRTGRQRTGASIGSLVRKWEESVKSFLTPGVLFEELGFRYFGPIDGHDIDALMETFTAVRDMKAPRLVHVITQKGKGLPGRRARREVARAPARTRPGDRQAAEGLARRTRRTRRSSGKASPSLMTRAHRRRGDHGGDAERHRDRHRGEGAPDRASSTSASRRDMP